MRVLVGLAVAEGILAAVLSAVVLGAVAWTR